MNFRYAIWIAILLLIRIDADGARQISQWMTVDSKTVEYYHENIYEGSEIEFKINNKDYGDAYRWMIEGLGEDGEYHDIKGYFYDYLDCGSVLFLTRLADLEGMTEEYDNSSAKPYYNLRVTAYYRETNGEYYQFDRLPLKVRIPDDHLPLRGKLDSIWRLDGARVQFGDDVKSGTHELEFDAYTDSRIRYCYKLTGLDKDGNEIQLFSFLTKRYDQTTFTIPLYSEAWKESARIHDENSDIFYHPITVSLYFVNQDDMILLDSKSVKLDIKAPSDFCRIANSEYFDGTPYEDSSYYFTQEKRSEGYDQIKWSISTDSVNENDEYVTVHTSKGYGCLFRPDCVNWENTRIIEESIHGVVEMVYYKMQLECYGNWGDVDCSDSKVFYIYFPKTYIVPPLDLPSVPKLSNFRFDPLAYDSETNSICLISTFCFNIECENATSLHVEIAVQDDYWNFGIPEYMDPFYSDMDVDLESPMIENGQYRCHYVELGDVIRVVARNKNGDSYSEPVAVNDYIDDPAILAILLHLKDIETGVDQPVSENKGVSVFQNYLETDSSIRALTVYSVDGSRVLEYDGKAGKMDISSLPDGVYLVRYSTLYNENLTLKFIKK